MHQTNGIYQANAKADRQKSADVIAKTCPDPSDLEFRNCLVKEVEKHYKRQIENEDLKAQKDMALWALSLLVVSTFSLLISGIGVLLLIGTIRQGKTAIGEAKAANQIMRDENRAEIVVKGIGLKPVPFGFHAYPIVQNVGKKSAIIIEGNFSRRCGFRTQTTENVIALRAIEEPQRRLETRVIHPAEEVELGRTSLLLSPESIIDGLSPNWVQIDDSAEQLYGAQFTHDTVFYDILIKYKNPVSSGGDEMKVFETRAIVMVYGIGDGIDNANLVRDQLVEYLEMT